MRSFQTKLITLAVSVACFSASSQSLAEEAKLGTLKDAAQRAVLTNPEVLSRWHAFKAADGEHDAAVGGFFPRLDFTTGKGKEHRDDPTLQRDYTRKSSTLTLTQMLYDGFATRNEVKRLDHARMTRLFELLDTSETAAMDAARAYFDVLRYRKLLSLAEENYVRHKSVFEQIQKKVQVGVGRRVDLEQAAGRLALAEANLLTETSNLHDVTARFQRIVGVSPARDLEEPGLLQAGLPRDPNSAQAAALQRNPALRAAVENLRAADSAHAGRMAPYQPRLDFRLRNDRGTTLNGIDGNTNNKTAEVVLTWNLFNSFSDVNRSRQYAEQLNVAKDLRDKTCRDVRQTLAIAYNDTRKLTEQLGYLDQHQLSIEKARDAYRKQFDIGQRTLLDLLDTENELFQAKRAYTNAEYDLSISYVRAHAGMGSLVEAMGLARVDSETKEALNAWAMEGDAADQCPPEAPTLYVVDKAALNARAQELLRESMPAAQTAAAPLAANGAKAGAAPMESLAAPAATSPATVPSAEMTPVQAVGEAMKAWVMAWSSKNLGAYLDAYAEGFTAAEGLPKKEWATKRKNTIERAKDIRIDISEVKVAPKDERHVAATFRQSYKSANYQDVVLKTQDWEKGTDGKWRIVGETSTPLK